MKHQDMLIHIALVTAGVLEEDLVEDFEDSGGVVEAFGVEEFILNHIIHQHHLKKKKKLTLKRPYRISKNKLPVFVKELKNFLKKKKRILKQYLN
jgi:hypothetical protein